MNANFWWSVLRFNFVTFVFGLFLFAIFFIIPLTYPFIIGFIFALLFNPFVNFLESKARFPRWLAVTVAIILLLSILVSIVVLVVIEVAAEVQHLQKILPKYIDDYVHQIRDFIMSDVVAFYDQFTAYYSSLDPDIKSKIDTQIENIATTLSKVGKDLFNNIINGISGFIRVIPNIVTAFIISLLASFFISKDWPKIRENLSGWMPDQVSTSGAAVLKDLKKALLGFIKAQLILISITFVIVLIGLLILRIEYALTLSIVIGLVDLLPYLGTGLVFVPWIIYLFITSQYKMVIGLSILYAVVLIQRQIMEPKVLGTNVGLDPLLTLVALFVGFQLFGFSGLIIGPVIMVIIGALTRAGVFRDIWRFIKGKPHHSS